MAKIVRIITRLNIGGPAIHAILLSSALNRKGGYEDILVCGRISEDEGDMLPFAREKGINPIVISAMQREISFRKDMSTFRALYSIIKSEKPDIIHTHMAKAGALGRAAAVLAGVPVRIHTFHGHIFDGYFSPFRARVFTFIERVLGFFTSKVITVSAGVNEDIVNRLKVVPKDKSVIIPLGLELEKFLRCDNGKEAFRKKMGLGEGVLVVGIIGRLVPIKNHKMFLDVARAVLDKETSLDIRFLIVGDGELRGEIARYVKKQRLENHAILSGWADDLPSVYAGLDVAALTSLNEGTPLSLIEAMASGRPVIATDVGGVADVVEEGHNGLLARSGDVEDFAAKLLKLLRDASLRSRLGERGRIIAQERFSKERLIGDIDILYRKLLSKSGQVVVT